MLRSNGNWSVGSGRSLNANNAVSNANANYGGGLQKIIKHEFLVGSTKNK